MLKDFKSFLLGGAIMSLSLVQAADCLTVDFLSDHLIHLINDGQVALNGKSYEINPEPVGIENPEHQIKNVQDLKMIFPSLEEDRTWIEKIDTDGSCRYAIARRWSNSRPGLMGAPSNITGGFMDLREVLGTNAGSGDVPRSDVAFVPIQRKANFTVSPRFQPKSLRSLLETGK